MRSTTKAVATKQDGKSLKKGCRRVKKNGTTRYKCKPGVISAAKRSGGATKKRKPAKRRKSAKRGATCGCPSEAQAKRQLQGHKDKPKMVEGAKVRRGKNGVCMVEVTSKKLAKSGLGASSQRFLRREC
jgi:hypothetical protein